VRRIGDRVEVHGDRRVIAHVGAALVARGPVPDDLSVEMPDLEDALVTLLDGDAGHGGSGGTDRPAADLVGAAR
jgi:hypothetical protein